MKKASRRDFLKLGSKGVLGLYLSSFLQPSFSFADTCSGRPVNLIFVNLLGGHDGLSTFPLMSGEVS